VRAGQIVRRLRDFMSHGEMERRSESLQRLINEANALALVGSREHGIDVQLSLDPRGDQVFVDRIQIQQVLVNLIRNAIEAMIDAPQRCLTLTTRSAPGELVEVVVEDTGPGMDQAVAPQLFQPFVTSKPNGMGIGLSICRTIVESQCPQPPMTWANTASVVCLRARFCRSSRRKGFHRYSETAARS